jgi:hypothetical protein
MQAEAFKVVEELYLNRSTKSPLPKTGELSR